MKELPGQSPRDIAWGLKTITRELIPGQFVLLDLDALPVSGFAEISRARGDVAAVIDRHTSVRCYKFPKWELELYASMKWRFPAHYFNSGVIVFQDTPRAHRLGELWHRHWLQAQNYGRPEDQPVFNSALVESQAEYSVLPGRYNCQFQNTFRHLRRAAIIHFFTVRLYGDTILARAIDILERDGKLDTLLLDEFARDKYPWTIEWLQALLACGLYRRAAVRLAALAKERLQIRDNASEQVDECASR